MSTEEQTSDTTLELTLTATLGIETVTELYEQLRPAIEVKQSVSVDASAVESADTASLQLLAAFAIELSERGTEIHWHAPSEPFFQSATISGLVETLQLPQAA